MTINKTRESRTRLTHYLNKEGDELSPNIENVKLLLKIVEEEFSKKGIKMNLFDEAVLRRLADIYKMIDALCNHVFSPTTCQALRGAIDIMGAIDRSHLQFILHEGKDYLVHRDAIYPKPKDRENKGESK